MSGTIGKEENVNLSSPKPENTLLNKMVMLHLFLLREMSPQIYHLDQIKDLFVPLVSYQDSPNYHMFNIRIGF